MKKGIYFVLPLVLLLFVLAGGLVFAAGYDNPEKLGDPCDTTAVCQMVDAEFECIGGDENEGKGNKDTGVDGNSGFCGLPLPPGPQGAGEVIQIIENITEWVFGIFLAVALIFLVWGAFEFVTGTGDPQKVASAKQRLIYAVIGIGLALLANSVPAVLRNIIV